MHKPIHPSIVDLHEVIGPRRVVEVDATGARRIVQILETTGETLSDEPLRPFRNTRNVIPFAASLRRVG